MWIWFNLEPDRLPTALNQAFADDESTFGISVVTIWETLTAIKKGRVEVVASPESTVRTWMRGNPFQIIPLDEEIAILSHSLPFKHDDPADRFISATAYHLMCPLATADERLRRIEWLSIFGMAKPH